MKTPSSKPATGIGRKYARPPGKTLIQVFTEPKDVKPRGYGKGKKSKKEKEDMNTTESIHRKPDEKHKSEHAARTASIFKEDVTRAGHKAEPEPPAKKEPDYLSPAAAASKEAQHTQRAGQGSVEDVPVVGALPKGEKPKPEDQSERILRILKTSRSRLQGRGMPELDIEVDELIKELEKGK
jgi:hypothetical protein